MKTKILSAVSVVLIAGGCCAHQLVHDDWQDNCKKRRNITVTIDAAGIWVAPANICATPGQALTVRIRRRHDVRDSVHATAKGSDTSGATRPGWLDQSNTAEADGFVFPVPHEREDSLCESLDRGGCKFQYQLTVDGVGTIDPMITVRR